MIFPGPLQARNSTDSKIAVRLRYASCHAKNSAASHDDRSKPGLQGTTLQMSADKRAQASQHIRRRLLLDKRQRARQDVQAALQATGIPARQLPASLLRSGATWI